MKIASGAVVIINDDTALIEGGARNIIPGKEHLTYRISTDGELRFRADENWEFYQYVFHYRFEGRTMQVTWRCGTLYGDPHPLDGLRSTFRDASTVAWDAFGETWAAEWGYNDMREAQRAYNACERMGDRLDRLFGTGDIRDRWERLIGE